MKLHDIRGFIDDRNETIGKKIRENELNKIPFLLILGEKEKSSNGVGVRKQGHGDLGTFSINDFVTLVNDEISNTLEQF